MAHNTREESKQTLGDVLPAVLHQVIYEGDVSHPEVLKVVNLGVLMVHYLMRVTLKPINFLEG